MINELNEIIRKDQESLAECPGYSCECPGYCKYPHQAPYTIPYRDAEAAAMLRHTAAKRELRDAEATLGAFRSAPAKRDLSVVWEHRLLLLAALALALVIGWLR